MAQVHYQEMTAYFEGRQRAVYNPPVLDTEDLPFDVHQMFRKILRGLGSTPSLSTQYVIVEALKELRERTARNR